MALLDDLLGNLSRDAPVRSLLVGVHWTAMCSRGCGLASTMMGGGPHGHERVREVGRLHLKSARELAEFARSENLLEASIGVAALNSLLEADPRVVKDINRRTGSCGARQGQTGGPGGAFPIPPGAVSGGADAVGAGAVAGGR